MASQGYHRYLYDMTASHPRPLLLPRLLHLLRPLRPLRPLLALLLLPVLLAFCPATARAWPARNATGDSNAPDLAAARALIRRIIPQRAEAFIVEPLRKVNGHDAFGLASRSGKIVLRGDNGV